MLSAVVGVSRIDGARIGDGAFYEPLLARSTKLNPRNMVPTLNIP